MRYEIHVDGGRNDDVSFTLYNPYGGQIGDSGRIINYFADTIWRSTTLNGGDGNYAFTFKNTMSIVSDKEIRVDTETTYFTPIQQTPSPAEQLTRSGMLGYLILVIILIPLGVIVAVIIKRSKKSYNEGKKLAEKNNNLIKDSIGKNTNDQKNIQILKERLAKGEITKEEYDTLKKEFEWLIFSHYCPW